MNTMHAPKRRHNDRFIDAVLAEFPVWAQVAVREVVRTAPSVRTVFDEGDGAWAMGHAQRGADGTRSIRVGRDGGRR